MHWSLLKTWLKKSFQRPTSTQSSVFVSGELENFWKNRSKEAKKQHTRENFNSSSVEKIYNFFLGTTALKWNVFEEQNVPHTWSEFFEAKFYAEFEYILNFWISATASVEKIYNFFLGTFKN